MTEGESSKTAAAGSVTTDLGSQGDACQQLPELDEHVPPKPSTGQDEERFAHTEVKIFQERVSALEAKLGLLEMVDESTRTATKLNNYNDLNAAYKEFPLPGRFSYQRNLEFYEDLMFFMRQVRRSHQSLTRYEQIQKETEELARKTNNTRGSDSKIMKEISTEAFLKKEPAKIIQVDWDVFAFEKTDMKKHVMAPIQVISSEPEPQTILQLDLSSRGNKTPNKLPLRQNERISPKWESLIEQPLPERIKIKSEALVAVLSKVTEFTTDKWIVARDGSLVILRPYQALIYIQSQLRDLLSELERKFENYDGKEPEQASKGDDVPLVENLSPKGAEEEAGENDHDQTITHDEDKDGDASESEKRPDDSETMALATSITALLHLRCLVQFMDAEFEPKRKYINSMQCSRIHFHDLWHLFKPGDEVISQEQKQAFVVLRVQIPRHKVEEPWERWNKRAVTYHSDSESDGEDDEDDEDDRPFTLHCVYIDFDGKNFGPVVKKFRISPFGELKQITSLPVYPLRYARDTQARDKIAKRGRMLLDVANPKAMYYMGVTMDKRDEIDSQVVIDFNEALADEDRRKAWSQE